MALVITFREGNGFTAKVGATEQKFVVEKITGKHLAVVKRVADQKLFTVTDTNNVEITRHVRVSIGREAPVGMIRLAIEAPRYIEIVREDKKHGHQGIHETAE